MIAWNDGIAPDGSRILLVYCGISYLDIIKAASECGTIVATAKRLGVGESTLQQCAVRHRLGHWFSGPVSPPYKSKITRRRLLYWARQGMTRKDIASALGCHYDTVNASIRRHKLTEAFPNKGKASWVARRGIAEVVS